MLVFIGLSKKTKIKSQDCFFFFFLKFKVPNFSWKKNQKICYCWLTFYCSDRQVGVASAILQSGHTLISSQSLLSHLGYFWDVLTLKVLSLWFITMEHLPILDRLGDPCRSLTAISKTPSLFPQERKFTEHTLSNTHKTMLLLKGTLNRICGLFQAMAPMNRACYLRRIVGAT